MSLDLGALVGRVVLEDVEFQRTYAKVIGQMRAGAGEAAKAAAGVSTLDRAFLDTAAAATAAAGGIDKAAKASAAAAGAGEKAAAAATRHAEATARVAAVMGPLADATTKEQTAALRLVAAQDRLNQVQTSGTATTARLAAAQAGVISASDRAASAQLAAMTATSKWRTAMGGLVRTAGELGIFVAGFEAVRAAIDIGKEASAYQRQMLQIQTLTGQSAGEVKDMSSAVLGLAGQVGTAPDDLAISLYHIEQNGIHGARALDVVRTAAEGAKIGLADVEETTNSMTSAVASGIKGVENLDQAMGVLLATVGTGDMKMSDLNEALSNGILSVGKTYGLSIRDIGAALAVFGDLNIRGKDAASQLRQAVMAFAKPSVGPAAKQVLEELGMTADTLAKDMQRGGLNTAVTDLKNRLDAAGITGDKVGKVLLDLFGKKAGIGVSILVDQYGRLQTKLHELQVGGQTFADKWTETTKSAGFEIDRLGAEAQATGIKIATSALPVLTAIAGAMADAIPAGAHLAGEALHPFAVAWHYVYEGAGPVLGVLEDLGRVLAPVLPYLKGVTGAVLAMWVAFKGYQVARFAVLGVLDLFAGLTARARNAAGDVAVSLGLMQRDMGASAEAMQIEAAQIEAQFAAIAASAERAAATQAEAQLAVAQAFETASDRQIAAMEAAMVAQQTAAAEAEVYAAETAAAADAAATAVDTAGASAEIGWASLAGPLALAAVGVLTVVSMFHRSTTASKEATDAAKAYTDALSGSGLGDRSTIVDTIVKQLSDNGVPGKLEALNKALGGTKFAGQQFVDAIQGGAPALAALRTHLQSVIDVQGAIVRQQNNLRYGGPSVGGGPLGGGPVTLFDPDKLAKSESALSNARMLLDDLNKQYSALTEAQRKELKELAAFGTAAVPIQQVSNSTHLASQTAQQYAQMLGFTVTKNGDVIGSSAEVNKAVRTVADAYNTATTAGSGFLDALASFSKSAGTASDRAALIGATLKAANGDALSYTAAMAGAFAANQDLVDSFQQQAQQVRQSAHDQQQAQNDIADAQANLTKVRKDAASTAQDVADAEKRLADAQYAAAQQAGLALADTEKAAINLNTGTIDYTKKGAPALVQQLQSIQDAAMKAAGAVYQHELATKGAKQAADDAYKVYQTMTSGQLVDEAGKLDITAGQAHKLAGEYFGMPKDVKTLIEQEGTSEIVTVLNHIGELLAKLTGQPWDVDVQVKVRGDKIPSDGERHGLDLAGPPTTAGNRTPPRVPHAAGGYLADGWFLAGEGGTEVGYKDGSSVRLFPRGVAPSGIANQPAAPYGRMPVSGAGFGQQVRIDNLNINYPMPERTSEALPQRLRQISDRLR